MIYIFHFFIVSILFILFGRNKRTEKIFIGSSFFYVLFVFGQRWMTGTDFPNYLSHFLTNFNGDEWGYYGLQTFLRDNNFYFGILIFVILLITQINYYRFFLKFKQYASLMIALFLISEMFLAQMSQIRQYVAISFFINSLFFSYDRKYLRSFINLILAGSFHSSALFLFPFLIFKFPFTKNLLTRKRLQIILFLAFILPFLNIQSVFSLPIFGDYSNYLDSSFNVPLGNAHYIKFYTMLLIFFVYVIFMKELNKTEKDGIVINGLVLYIILYGLSFKFAMLFRVAMYFQTFEIVYLVYYSDKLKNVPEFINKRLVTLLFLGIFSFSALFDSYLIADYQFRPLRLYENRTVEQLTTEIERF